MTRSTTPPAAQSLTSRSASTSASSCESTSMSGAQYNCCDPQAWFGTAGAGVSWNFVKQWSVISEVFAIVGPDQTNPRWQSGIRYSPNKNVDWDLIYGRNIAGEGANWITFALTVRIGNS